MPARGTDSLVRSMNDGIRVFVAVSGVEFHGCGPGVEVRVPVAGAVKEGIARAISHSDSAGVYIVQIFSHPGLRTDHCRLVDLSITMVRNFTV